MMVIHDGAWDALVFLAAQMALFGVFSFFASFNFLYGLASLIKPGIPTTEPSGKQIAVVIVAYNEQHVIEATIRACDALTYPNTLLIVADDSSDPDAIDQLRRRRLGLLLR